MMVQQHLSVSPLLCRGGHHSCIDGTQRRMIEECEVQTCARVGSQLNDTGGRARARERLSRMA